jgi:DNA-binding CsgD family transcriptional regulator
VAKLVPDPRLVGREVELRVLGEALDRVESGRPAMLLIEGEAGIGKTRLLEHALADAGARGMEVVAGRADELERTRPFGLLAAAFACTVSSPDPRRAGIAGLLATHGAGEAGPITVTSDPGLQFRAVDAFTDLAEALALSGPLVIGLDDLQWADPSSLLTVGTIGRRLGHVPVAVVGSLRLAPRSAELARLVSALETAGAGHLLVGPLADGAVRDLVADTIAAEPGPGLLAEISGAAGNPLFITELLRSIIEEGAIVAAGGRAGVMETTMPPTLRHTILRRLTFLSDDTLPALRTASILGSVFSLTDLATIADRPAFDVSTALAEAFTAGILQDDGVQLRFRHDLIRDSIYEDLPASVRRGLHREAGQRLGQSGASALRVAEHLARGATQGDAEAVEWLTRAAREEMARSPDVAAGLLDRAIALTGPADHRRDRLLAERATSLMSAGRAAEAEQICRALLDRAHDPGADGPARICLGYSLVIQGRGRDALQELEMAARSPVLTAAERAGARAWESIGRASLGDLEGAAAVADQARSLAATAGDHQATSLALGSLALISELRGDLLEALRIIDDAVRLADRSPARQGHRYSVHTTRGWILMELDRFEEARSALDIGRRTGEELGAGWRLGGYEAVRAVERFVAGEWDDAIAEVEASVEPAGEIGQTYDHTLGYSVLSLISVHRNDLPRAREAAAAATAPVAAIGPGFRPHLALWARALILEVDGRIAEALDTLAEVWDQCTRFDFALEHWGLAADLVRLAVARGERGRARDVAAAVAEFASRNETPSLAGAVLRCRGLAEDDVEILEAAAGAYARGPRPLELALAAEDAGGAFARLGRVDQARELLEQAVSVYERLGAARDLLRAEATLRAAGIRRGRRGTRSRPQTGWNSLTPTEQTVASLVAEGLSNPRIGDRLYISRRTVQTHLAHVFTKLDINSRAQLAAQVARHSADRPAGGTDPGGRE